LTGIDWVLIDGQPDNEALEQDWARALFAAAEKAGAQVWFPFAKDDREAQIAQIAEYGLPTLEEMHAQLEAAVAREAEAEAVAVIEVDPLPVAVPTPLPVTTFPALTAAPDPAPEPLVDETPKQTANAMDSYLLSLWVSPITKTRWKR
jgi:hypothetical protein